MTPDLNSLLHFFVFGLITFVVIFLISQTRKSSIGAMALTFFFVLGPLLAEVVWSQFPNRTFSIQDVVSNYAGCFLGFVLLTVFLYFYENR